MDKKLINEDIANMKYLFGYKAGRVISEQEQPEIDEYFYGDTEDLDKGYKYDDVDETNPDDIEDDDFGDFGIEDDKFEWLPDEDNNHRDEITESKEIKEYFGGSEGVVNVDISGEGYLKSFVSKEIIKFLHNVGGDINLTINGDSVIRSGNR